MRAATVRGGWTTHAAVFAAGLAVGVALACLAQANETDDDATPPTATGAPPAARAPVNADRARPDDRAHVTDLETRLADAQSATVALRRERDEAVQRLERREPSLLDLIAAVDSEAAIKLERMSREELVEARSVRIELHWEDVVGPGLPRADRSVDTCFARFWAELRRPRTQEESRRLYESFSARFGVRLEDLVRRDAELRRRVKRDEYAAASAELRRERWQAAEVLVEDLRPLLDDDERTELRLRGSPALGIPGPAERLRLGWSRLLGDDVEPPAPELLVESSHDPFAWVYECLERERSREELRAIHGRLRAAQAANAAAEDPDARPLVYESVKDLLSPGEWLRLRYYPEGALRLSR